MTRVPPTVLLTAEQLASHSRWNDCELWDGIPVVKGPSGGYAPYLAAQLTGLLGQHVSERHLGWGLAADAGFILRRNPDRVLSPDLAFVSFAKMPEPPQRGFPELVPDFVVEVRSSDQWWREILAKGFIWTSHGVPVVWLIDPLDRKILTLRPDASPLEARPGGSANAAPALPDFTVAVDDLFPHASLRRLGHGDSEW